MKAKRIATVAFSASMLVGGCAQHDLRGTYSASKDGRTYLIVSNDPGPSCYLKVDGKTWPNRNGEPALIASGTHIIESECGGAIEFDIKPGVIYRFDYWGP